MKSAEGVFYVYIHRDPRDMRIKWVGKGCKNRAFKINPGERAGKHKNWIKTLNSLGLKPLVELIFVGLQEKDALKMEISLISFFRSSELLKNMTNGGEGSSGFKHSVESNKKNSIAHKGIIPSEETRRKISELATGRTHSEETKIKCSIQKMGNKSRTGMKNSQETRDKISKSRRRPLIDDLGNIYNSATEAAEITGIYAKGIARAARGKRKTAGGRKFKYIDKMTNYDKF